MATYLKSGLIPTSVGMNRSPNKPITNFKGSKISFHIDREVGLEELPSFIPINFGLEIDSGGIMVEANILSNLRLFRDLEDVSKDYSCVVLDHHVE